MPGELSRAREGGDEVPVARRKAQSRRVGRRQKSARRQEERENQGMSRCCAAVQCGLITAPFCRVTPTPVYSKRVVTRCSEKVLCLQRTPPGERAKSSTR